MIAAVKSLLPLGKVKFKRRIRCSMCKELAARDTAHWHQSKWICDQKCWDERLRSTE